MRNSAVKRLQCGRGGVSRDFEEGRRSSTELAEPSVRPGGQPRASIVSGKFVPTIWSSPLVPTHGSVVQATSAAKATPDRAIEATSINARAINIKMRFII